MSKRNEEVRAIFARDGGVVYRPTGTRRRRRQLLFVAIALVSVLAVGVFAKNRWFSSTDPLTGKRTSWFGQPLASNAGSSWNPLAAPTATPAPQLSKEYIYSGSRLLSVVDANAQETPPADLAVWRPSSGGWWVMGGQWSQQVTQNWGSTGDDPVEGDYDGDGKTDFAVFRPSTNTWYIVNSSTGTTGQFPFGSSGDVPAPADYDGDEKTDGAVYRPSDGTWYVRLNNGASQMSQQFGLSTDKIAPADYS